MCGICGIAYHDYTRPVEPSALSSMRDALAHRGPDMAGHYLAPGIGLGVRRLSIFDLSERGHMPMSTPDNRFHIIYNGAVYNYPELRAHLEARGWRFRSNTDTEVLVYLYAEEGPRMLALLNGMFSFAIWDARERVLFLARDRMGVKPLYYTHDDEALRFASEEKSLFAGGLARQFDETTWEELLCFRYIAGERTPFVNVKRLLPGHYLLWRSGEDPMIRRWWHLSDYAQTSGEKKQTDLWEKFRETFDSAVSMRRISDVPVGVLLSGGLDSGSILASLASQSAPDHLSSFTVRFGEAKYDEGQAAQQMAERWKVENHSLTVAPENLLEMLRAAARLNDEPLAHANDSYVLAIAQFARRKVTVLLSGEGADETLGGYVRYRPLNHPALLSAARRLLPLWQTLGRANYRTRKLVRMLQLGSLDRCVLFNACEVLPTDLAKLDMRVTGEFAYRKQILREAQQLYPNEPVRQAMYSDQHTFLCSLLDRNDRMTMGASIECRTPFMDYRLVEMAAALPSSALFGAGAGKQVLRRAIGDRLPSSIRRGKKWGFGVPWSAYFRQAPELRHKIRELHRSPLMAAGPFSARKLKQLSLDFLNGDQQQEPLIRQVLMLAVWHETTWENSSVSERSQSRSAEVQPCHVAA